MRSILAPLVLFALVSAAPVHAEGVAKPLALGKPAPMRQQALRNVDGKDVTLASVAGPKGTLVVFTCNHCPWAKAWASRIAEVGNAAAAAGVGVIAINSNDPAAYPEDDFDTMVARAKELGLTFPYVVDGTSAVAQAFGATRTPEVFLFDAKGRLVYHGAIDDNRDESQVKERFLADAVTVVASGRAYKPRETKAIGCGIKFREPAGD